MGSASLEIHHVQIHEVQRIGLMELELARAPLVESRQKYAAFAPSLHTILLLPLPNLLRSHRHAILSQKTMIGEEETKYRIRLCRLVRR